MTTNKKKILAISGSTRKNSTNSYLINAIAHLTAAQFDLEVFDRIADIPHFNPDRDNETAPEEVFDFRRQIREADGVLICTPEYAMGVPGSLKNAIDWTVSSCEFSHKPVALITASSLGQKGHAALLETLNVIESKITEDTQLVISFVKTKVSNASEITDPKTLTEVKNLINAFDKIITNVQ